MSKPLKSNVKAKSSDDLFEAAPKGRSAAKAAARVKGAVKSWSKTRQQLLDPREHAPAPGPCDIIALVCETAPQVTADSRVVINHQ